MSLFRLASSRSLYDAVYSLSLIRCSSCSNIKFLRVSLVVVYWLTSLISKIARWWNFVRLAVVISEFVKCIFVQKVVVNVFVAIRSAMFVLLRMNERSSRLKNSNFVKKFVMRSLRKKRLVKQRIKLLLIVVWLWSKKCDCVNKWIY